MTRAAEQIEIPIGGRLGRFPAGSRPVETSEDAAASLDPGYLNRIRLRVLSFVEASDCGSTADEIAFAFGVGHNTTSPRVTELAALGYLERLDGKQGRPKEKRRTRTGRPAFVYRITSSGRALIGSAS